MVLRAVVAVGLLQSALGEFYEPNQKYYPFTDLDCTDFADNMRASYPPTAQPATVCDCDTPLKGSVVDIEDGFKSGTDKLVCEACTEFDPEFKSDLGLLFIKTKQGQTKTIGDFITALKSVYFLTTDTSGDAREITYNFGHGFYSSHTGHYYEYYADYAIQWFPAQTKCAADDHMILGLRGYLITITSEEEEHVAESKLGGQGWMGSSDAGAEDTWRWVVGPEGCPNNVLNGGLCDFGNPTAGTYPKPKPAATSTPGTTGNAIGTGPEKDMGTHFFTDGTGGPQPTDPISGQPRFAKWSRGEPNNWKNNCPGSCAMQGEDFGHFLNSGYWNDYPQDHPEIDGYICEWGGIGDLCLTPDDARGTKTIHGGCGSYTSAQSCNNHPGGMCVWDDTKTPKCQLQGCARWDDEKTCDHDPSCEWKLDANGAEICATKYCVQRYGDETSCNADPQCHWAEVDLYPVPTDPPKTAMMCQEFHCGSIKDRCECQQYPQCNWDAQAGSCIGQVYSGCPGADIVFVMDASGSMNAKFGKHKNGYYGMIEQIRAWLKDAPLTQELSSVQQASQHASGFRAGFISFGRPDTTGPSALYAPSANWPCIGGTAAGNSGCGGCNPATDPWCVPNLPCESVAGGNGGFKNPDAIGCVAAQPGGFGTNVWYDTAWQKFKSADGFFSGTNYKAPQKWKPPFPIPGTTGESAGHISGSAAEMGKDLDWHEEFFYPKWSNYRTILLPALGIAEQWFHEDAYPKTGPLKRKHILFILTDGALHDKDKDVQDIEDRMKNDVGVEVFGVVMRKGKSQSSASRAAEKKLKPLTSDPHDSHFLNIPLEDLKTDILDKLCDPNSIFGQEFTKGGQLGGHCEVLKTQATCVQDVMCEWSAASNECVKTTCLPACDQNACTAMGRCKWDPTSQLCTRNPSCSSNGDQASCTAQQCCEWTGTACQEDYCCVHGTENNCAAFTFTPRPSCLPTLAVSPDPPTGGCPGDPPIDCAANPCSACCDVVGPCMWSPGKSPACEKKPCVNLWTPTQCSTDPQCVWKTDVSPQVCTTRPCNYNSMGECVADPQGLCTWDVTKTPMCQVKYCAKYTTEADCKHDPICTFDCHVQPCVCKRSPCGEKENAADCAADPDCTWSASSSKLDAGGSPLPTTAAYAVAPAHCKPHTCSDYNSPVPIANKEEAACLCNKDPKCVWHVDHCSETQFNRCPDLDVLMVLDGSGSMRRQFGHHNHGFYGLMEMLRDWMTHLPLTGTGAGQPVPAQTGRFRIGFIQFSRPGSSGIRVCPASKGCTGGKLSGLEAELQKDIDYHEANFIGSTTVLEPALLKAQEVLDPAQDSTIGNRRRVMIVICDGQLKDKPLTRLDAPIDALTDGGQAGGGLGVTIFGVVMRRFQQHTQEDYDAERLLKPIVSSPQDDHFMNLPLDDIPAQLLDSFCDPNSKLGKIVAPATNAVTVHTDCSIWGYPDECNVNPMCEWQQPALRQGDCANPAECPSLGCQRVPPQYAAVWSCDTCRPQRGTIECGMQYVPAATLAGHCGLASCASHCNQGECSTDPKCVWDAAAGQCVRKVCKQTDKTTCSNDPDSLCQWNAASNCEKKPCEATFVKGQCEAKAATDNCQWDTGFNPPVCRAVVDCPQIQSQDQCQKNPACAWDTCNPNIGQQHSSCTDFTSEDLCARVPGCSWAFDIPNEKFVCGGTPATDCASQFPNAQPVGSGQCRYKKCVYTNLNDCTADRQCLWDTSMTPVQCRENICFPYGTQGDCGTDPKCVWVANGVPPYCTEGCGAQDTQPKCDAYGGCAWDPNQSPQCYQPYCAKLGNSEQVCNQDPRCHWDTTTTPPSCGNNPCMQQYGQMPMITAPTALAGGSAACDAAPECSSGSDANGAYCKPQSCGDHTNKCDCDKAKNCVWRDNGNGGGSCIADSFSSCPDLDVVFILDGSGSMAAPFGLHPHGFLAMIEMLRDWVKTLPLTGEDKSVGKNSAVTGGTIRLSFIQFSGRNRREGWFQVATCGGCTDGRLSGTLAQLDKDLTWHEDNYYKKGTMIYESMHKALEVFQSDSPKHRNHVLIMVTDGELFDPEKLPPVRASLDQVDVQTFGVVVRKGQAHTPDDLKAQQTLKPVTSDPHDDHFINVPMDDVPSALLNDFCDPNSVFGRQIQQRFGSPPTTGVICGQQSLMDCLQEPQCDLEKFSSNPPVCADGTSCPNLNCYARPDALKSQYRCTECKLAAGQVECQAGFMDTAVPVGFCKSSKCTCLTTEGTCTADSDCEWKGTPPTCQRKICTGLPQDKCTAAPMDQLCEWKTPGDCQKKPCLYDTPATCNADNGCFWNPTKTPAGCEVKKSCSDHNTPQTVNGLVQPSWPQWNNCLQDPSGICVVDTFCPPANQPACTDTMPTCRDTYCPYNNQAQCQADKRCLWDSSVNAQSMTATQANPSVLCIERKCPRYLDQADCTADPLCVWDATKDPKCFEDECAQIPGEAKCNQNHHCKYDVSLTPASCTTRYCWGQYGTNKLGCQSDPKCMFDQTLGTGGECTEKVCSKKYTNPCDCRADPDCTWDLPPGATTGICLNKNVGGCPPLDLTIVLDGSGSMMQSFAPHANGYYALLEVVRDWVKTLPLTGTATGVIPTSQQTGFRVSLIQFSGENNPGQVNVDPTTKGMLTGDLAELEGALNWHEANPIFRKTYIQRALETAVEAFRTSPPNRHDVLLIFTDGALSDPEALGPAEAELAAEGVKSFGVVVRRFQQKTQTDIDAEKTLKQIVSDPRDSHYLNLQVDEISSSVLDSFCSQNGPFGAFIVGGAYDPDQLRTCSQRGSDGVCSMSEFCKWDLVSGTCKDHPCRSLCTQSDCATDSTCKWNVAAQECGKVSCTVLKDQATCAASPIGCTWDVNTVPPCQPTTGCAKYTPQGQPQCTADGSCMWLGAYTVGGASGNQPAFKDLKCADIATFKAGCSCSTTIKGSFVEIEDNYDPATDSLACGAPCAAVGIKEEFDKQTGFLHLESADGSDKTVDDYAKAMAAVVFTTTSKDGKPRKITRNFGHGFFSSVTGHYYRFFPHEANEPTVEWQDAQDRCSSPSNKLLGLTGYLITVTSKEEQEVAASKLKGEGWMGGSDAAKEGEWRWVTGPEGCPPKAGCDLMYNTANGNADGPDAGRGLNFWDGKGQSGVMKTFAHWQRNEPNHYSNNCPGSCSKIGEDFAHFLNGGDWNDYPYDHRSIDGYICEWGGIGELCMSMNDAHSSVLMGATVGKCVEKCTSWTTQTDCTGAGCRWDGTKCLPPDACTPIGETDCHASPTCFYDATADPKRCTPVFTKCSDIKNQQVCDGYPLCEQQIPPATPPKCTANPMLKCEWASVDIGCPPSVCGACRDKPCQHTTAGTCNADTGCVWVSPPEVIKDTCVPKTGCSDMTSADACTKLSPPGMGGITPCVWDAAKTPKCDLNKCAKLRDAATCGADIDCKYDTAVKPPVCVPTVCYPHGSNQATCVADPSGMCGFDKTLNKCVVKHCGVVYDRCDCIADPTCAWDASKGVCRTGAFSGCPDLDLALLFDGSGSMTKPFVDNHPQGYTAMLEMIRSWVRTLPLTGEKAGTPSTNAAGAFRMSFIQFSEETKIAVDPTTQGELTGSSTEIDSAITWHEANHMMRQTFIKLGLDKAVEVFRSSPGSRKKVLLIITDGRITDTAQLAAAEAELVAEGVKTFGVVVRQAAAQTQVDLDAFASLKEIVSDPKDLHALDLTMDEFGSGVLAKFCDASGPFGKYIAASSSSPACTAQGEAGCQADAACMWNAYTQSCGDHPCAAHCTQAQCSADTSAGGCVWDAAAGKCTKSPCCHDKDHGTCTSTGCCDCVIGWHGCNVAPGTAATCHLYQVNDKCSWCHPQVTCSGHGICLSTATAGDARQCDCLKGWSGVDCSVPMCEPSGAYESTTYPKLPVSNQPFRFVLHGCGFSSADRVTLVKVPATCADDPHAADCGCGKQVHQDCVWPKSKEGAIEVSTLPDNALSPDGAVLSSFGGLRVGQRVVQINDKTVTSEGIDLAAFKASLPNRVKVVDAMVLLEGDCAAGAIMTNPVVEPNSTMELSFSAYMPLGDTAHYQVCYQPAANTPVRTGNVPVLTHDGSDKKIWAQKICKMRGEAGCEDAGVSVRSAAAADGGVGMECECHGLIVGNDGCVHWIYFLILLLLAVAILIFAAYMMRQKEKEKKSLQEAKYEDLSMEAMAKENMREQMLDRTTSRGDEQTGERADV
eukprot:TRINITY_DN5100_c0_g1_i1.p1 TRINITY_DN5100_c0_g1~~TRINITY_DN5100_c0_g1_i1.p1  ORF type:complete len:4202 (+),score=1474.65 TRINITY_DN5100_c0_g1_i1:160-12765(+)